MGKIFTRRVALAVGAAVLAGVGVATNAAPASAAATCPSGHICFFHDEDYRGSMSDRTAQLTGHYRADGNDGTISDFRQYGYFNPSAGSLNDSISSIVNNSGSCLSLWGNVGFQVPGGHSNEVIVLSPYTRFNARDYESWYVNDKFSSAATYVSWEPDCAKYIIPASSDVLMGDFYHNGQGHLG